MDISLLIFTILLATFTGTITGLIPGLHINLISGLILANIATLINNLSLNYVIIFIIVMSLTHTFIDFIPSIIFGVPSADTALSILPGHKMILKGKGYEAIYLSSIGSFLGVITSLFIGAIFYFILETLYSHIKALIPYILTIVVISLIAFEPNKNKKFWAILIVFFSGGYGLFVLNSKIITNPLLILFSGVFGISTIIQSLQNPDNSKLPKQTFEKVIKYDKDFVKSTFIGTLSASICSITPGIGNIQAATISSTFLKSIKTENFILILSLINTLNFTLSLITFYTINKARNGSIFIISQISSNTTIQDILIYYLIILLSSIGIFFLTIHLGKKILKSVSNVNFNVINISILSFLLILITSLQGLYGLFLLTGATAIGMLAITLNVKRAHLMNVLIVPIIFNLI